MNTHINSPIAVPPPVTAPFSQGAGHRLGGLMDKALASWVRIVGASPISVV